MRRQPHDRPGLPAVARAQPERRLERETGIEPATNSLEGCDSTTELLPPTRSPTPPLALRRARTLSSSDFAFFDFALLAHRLACRADCSLAHDRARSERRLVAREGFEPSKPLGRQIYSLLRLTASLPRRYSTAHVPGRVHVCPAASGDPRPVSRSTRPVCRLVCQDLRRSRCAHPGVAPSLDWRESWSWRRDLNPRPADYKSAALPD